MVAPTLPEGATHDRERRELGRYKILGTLGAGGMGVVLAARDPDLDRAVALKLLHPTGQGAAVDELRLTREARTMARLSHPNVVTVYEVGTFGGQLFVAMELIDGSTLRAWLTERARTWREIVTMFIEVGRGLAAAHEHGVVHRDFKPDNVLIGGDGRPRVTDFGLAATNGEPHHAIPFDEAAPNTCTIAGTPAYMAPEQWDGRPADPRSDQFAFGVALWEGIHGERPFAGELASEARLAAKNGELRAPAKRVPRWLDAALRRSLAAQPAARWPALTALLDHLSSRLRRRAWAIGATASTSIAAAAALIAGRALMPGAAVCDLATLDRAWGPVQRAEITLGMAATRTSSNTVSRVGSALDAWAERWRATRAGACREVGPLADRRHACLDRAGAHMRLVVEQLAAPTGPVAARALRLVHELPGPEACLGARVTQAVAMPADPRVTTILGDLDAARVADRTLRRTESRAAATRAVTSARGLGQPSLLAEALMLDARFAHDRDRAARKAELAEALQLATRGKDRYLQAAITLELFQQATHEQNPEALAAIMPVAGAAIADSDDDRLRRLFALYEARALAQLDRPQQALAACARVAQLEPPPYVDAEACRCQADGSALRLPEAERSCRAAVDAAVAVYGEDAAHAEISNLALALSRVGAYDRALAARARVREIVARVFGPSSAELAGQRDATAALYLNMGKPALARPEVEAAIAIWSRLPSRPAQDLANARSRLAEVRGLLGDPAGGAEESNRALAEIEAAVGPSHPKLAVHLLKHGEANARAGRHEIALASFARGAELAERAYGASHLILGLLLSHRAGSLLELRRANEARPPAERAVAILTATATPADDLADAHLVLGRALVATGERRGGRDQFSRARDVLGTQSDASARLAEVERLLGATR
jgi:eukaryotic-like serine/threonine-protein kinase